MAHLPAPGAYPGRWEADVVLRDGATVHVRPIRPSDVPRIVALHGRLSAESIYLRFFGPLTKLSARMLERFVQVDYVERLALVALLGDDVIAVGRYERLTGEGPGVAAEVAFLVDDAHQGRGLGTVLLEHLAAAAREAGIVRFVADTLPENRRMLSVFHQAGFGDERSFGDGVVRVAFPIQPTEASLAASWQHERRAAASSVRRLLAPRSVAVIGASRREGTLGNALARRVVEGGFKGAVHAVNPHAGPVAGLTSYPSVEDVPDPVDLAVVVVPAAAVGEVVEACARSRVGGLVVVSAGFAERDAAGVEAERRLVRTARRNGMRLIGPNCMGVVNTDPRVSLNATFSPMPASGRIGFVAQSGGLGATILDEMGRRGLGVSTFVSAGNKADVSGNDLLQYWDDDPATDVIGMYIETFGNPRTFARVARRVSRRKPIVAVKAGRSRAAGLASHRRLQSDAAVDALFRRTGVIRTTTLEELLDVTQVLASQPLPGGRRVAIVGPTGGPGVIAADAADAARLEVVPLGEATRRRLAGSVPWAGAADNPVDLAPDAGPGVLAEAVAAVLADEAVDAVIALCTSPMSAHLDDVADALRAAQATAPGTPIVASALGHRGLLGGEGRPGTGGEGPPIPSFAFPETAARALGRVAEHAAWLARPAGAPVRLPDVDRAAARLVIEEAAASGDGSAAPMVLAAYGVGAVEGAPSAVLRVEQDVLFGPLVTLAAGATGPPGSPRSLPLTDLDAAEMRAEVLPALDGDGAGELDGTVARVARLVEDAPEVAELDVGVVTGTGRPAVVVRRLRLAPAEPHPERALRRLR